LGPLNHRVEWGWAGAENWEAGGPADRRGGRKLWEGGSCRSGQVVLQDYVSATGGRRSDRGGRRMFVVQKGAAGAACSRSGMTMTDVERKKTTGAVVCCHLSRSRNKST